MSSVANRVSVLSGIPVTAAKRLSNQSAEKADKGALKPGLPVARRDAWHKKAMNMHEALATHYRMCPAGCKTKDGTAKDHVAYHSSMMKFHAGEVG